MADNKPQIPSQPAKPDGITEARKTQLAQHYSAAVDKAGVLAHFREYGTPEEKAFIEKLANPRG